MAQRETCQLEQAYHFCRRFDAGHQLSQRYNLKTFIRVNKTKGGKCTQVSMPFYLF